MKKNVELSSGRKKEQKQNSLHKMCKCNPYIVCIEDRAAKQLHQDYVGISVTHLCQNIQAVLQSPLIPNFFFQP